MHPPPTGYLGSRTPLPPRSKSSYPLVQLSISPSPVRGTSPLIGQLPVASTKPIRLHMQPPRRSRQGGRHSVSAFPVPSFIFSRLARRGLLSSGGRPLRAVYGLEGRLALLHVVDARLGCERRDDGMRTTTSCTSGLGEQVERSGWRSDWGV